MANPTNKYYQSHSKLNFIGPAGQEKLSAAKVLVIGAGGLGCPCLQILAGCGIGTIGIADFDIVSLNNLHRQTLYQFNDVGQPKVAIAAQRLSAGNPFITINQYQFLIDDTHVLDVVDQYDLVVDCTDNFAVRYLINDACVYLGKPLIYGAIYQAEGHLTVFNYKNSATLRCLFTEGDAETNIPSCAEIGAYNVVAHIIGAMMANEVVKVILHNPQVLANQLLTFDALQSEMRTIKYKPYEQNRAKSIGRFKVKQMPEDISPDELVALPEGTYHLIDVREDWEHEEFNIGGSHIPLAAIAAYNFDHFLKTDKLIFYCQQGQRSKIAATLLRKKGFANAISLKGGLNLYRSLV